MHENFIGGRKLQLKVHETLSVCDTKKGNPRGFPFLYLLIAAVYMRLEAIYYHIESDGIFSALLHDDISHSLTWLNIKVMHRLDGGCILREHRFKCAGCAFPYRALFCV